MGHPNEFMVLVYNPLTPSVYECMQDLFRIGWLFMVTFQSLMHPSLWTVCLWPVERKFQFRIKHHRTVIILFSKDYCHQNIFLLFIFFQNFKLFIIEFDLANCHCSLSFSLCACSFPFIFDSLSLSLSLNESFISFLIFVVTISFNFCCLVKGHNKFYMDWFWSVSCCVCVFFF